MLSAQRRKWLDNEAETNEKKNTTICNEDKEKQGKKRDKKGSIIV